MIPAKFSRRLAVFPILVLFLSVHSGAVKHSPDTDGPLAWPIPRPESKIRGSNSLHRADPVWKPAQGSVPGYADEGDAADGPKLASRMRNEGGRPPGLKGSLQDSYRQGEIALAENRPLEAETLFKAVLEADSNDWEARERLVGIYQTLGFKEERDRQLVVLRRMYHTGLAWKPFIVRERFRHGEKFIRALEVPGMESRGRWMVLFMVSDLATGRFLYVVKVKQKEKSGPVTASKPDGARSYELTVIKQARRKSFEIVNRKPGYADMKRVFLKTL